jgi:3-(3-hydroxy-phenyl)propionate hydroxylase
MTQTGEAAGGPPAADVLIVGAGPTGLVAACELLRRGVRVRIVDSLPAAVPYSKALLLWPRTIDVFAGLGLADAVPQRGVPIRAFRYYTNGRPLARVDFPEELTSWALPQARTETLLLEKLTELGGHVERGVRLLALDRLDFSGDPRTSPGVTAILEHPDGRIERHTTPWLIGADGAGSAVRAQAGLGFTGATYESKFLLGDAYLEGGGLAADEAHYYQSPRGVLVIVALPDGLFRFFASAPPGDPGPVDLAAIQRLVDERGPGGLKLVDPEWVSAFRIHRRQAEKFQLGRVFLVGDAAHVHSPAGGQGLNTGIQDAHNLAWKLAAVIRRESGLDLLDSYTPERHKVAAQVVRDTDLQTRAWLVRHPAAVAARDLAFRVADRAGVIRRAYLPVLAGRRIRYPATESTALLASARKCENRGPAGVGAAPPPEIRALLGLSTTGSGEPRAWTLLIDPAERVDVPGAVRTIPTPRNVLAAAGCDHTGFILLRPDGFVAARGHQGDFGALRRWLDGLLTPDPEQPDGSPALPAPRTAAAVGEAVT